MRSLALCAADLVGRWRAAGAGALAVCCLAVFVIVANAIPAASAAEPAAEQAMPGKVQQLLDLLGDPEVQAWIERHRSGSASTNKKADPAASAPAPSGTESMQDAMAQELGGIRERIIELIEAIPQMPAEFARAEVIFASVFTKYGALQIGFLFIAFVGLGFGTQWLYRQLVRPIRQYLVRGAALTSVRQRVGIVLLRFGLGLGLVVSFALGSVGAFLSFDWPPLLKDVVLGYLIASLSVQLARAVSLFLISAPAPSRPNAASYRIIPLTNEAALFWDKRLILAVTWIAYGSATIALLGKLGFSPQSQDVLHDALSLGLLIIGIESTWRSPKAFLDKEAPALWSFVGRPIFEGLMSVYLVLLWLLWVAGFPGLFALAVVLVGLPLFMDLGQRAANHILRPPGAEDEEAAEQSVTAVILERGIRALLIVGAAALLGHAWQLDMMMLTTQDTMFTRLLRGLLNAVVIALVADLFWHVTRVIIDRKLRSAGPPGTLPGHETSHQARLRTLLPILRNGLFVLILAIAIMMALSSMGVAIGPLIASAGVLGVAVGFGSQTLVRDIISGVFYLLDDAFRVGEYIQSGNYKGVVESFSLRSVKLRHHRGPLYTIPFGTLGAVQNMSRDWTIDKITVGVTYDTDLAKVKQLTKEIGKELLQDPECQPVIIETLKMQGVERFGDYAIHLRMKMTTKPGEQFIVRRRALALIKEKFDANGIAFAFPVVRVDGADAASAAAAAAAARQGLELVRPPQASSTAA